jgi:DNA-binding MarR family transcriptional regulator
MMPSSAVPDPVDAAPSAYTGFLFRRAQQAHVALWQSEVSSSISSVQFGALSVLSRLPGSSQQDLCDELDLDRSTIADVVQRLEQRGLIERRRDESDRRRNRLALTERGVEAYAGLRPKVDTVEAVLTGALTASERRQLRSLLTKVLFAARHNDSDLAPFTS